jgi:hypothetical protein
LRRRDSDIEQHAVDRLLDGNPCSQRVGQIAEAVVHDKQSLVDDCAGHGHRLRVAVERQQATLWPESFEDGPLCPPRPKVPST